MTQYRHISFRSHSQIEKNLWFNIILTAGIFKNSLAVQIIFQGFSEEIY